MYKHNCTLFVICCMYTVHVDVPDVNEEDLEAELLALTGEGGRKKPRKVIQDFFLNLFKIVL